MGHDFRPAYLKIAHIKAHFPKVPFLALTATATARVKKILSHNSDLKNPIFYKII
jgi:ATP-dependent DNA helicase RecQ